MTRILLIRLAVEYNGLIQILKKLIGNPLVENKTDWSEQFRINFSIKIIFSLTFVTP